MILVLAGTFQEAEIHAAVRGYAPENWTFATSEKLHHRQGVKNVSRIDMVGSYRLRDDWGEILMRAKTRMSR